jgi:hypothetical protein
LFTRRQRDRNLLFESFEGFNVSRQDDDSAEYSWRIIPTASRRRVQAQALTPFPNAGI